MEATKVGILGAGTMGRQLALLFASNNVPVSLWNHRCQPNFQAEFGRLALIQSKLGLLEKDKIAEIIGKVTYTNELAGLSGCELVLEAVTEDKDVKVNTLKQLVQLASNLGIIATNTSTLSITELAASTNRPGQFIGLHFFNPPLTMKLVEVIKGELTSDETLQATLKIIEALEKHPVVLPETPGFVVNRLLFPMINEAVFLLSEGVSDAKTIDSCMRMGANHPMGPLELADLIGLDVCLSILETLVDETGDGKYRAAPLLKKYVRAGKLGKKTGCGFYNYKRN
ncbi:MAG: 3-hydroxyacyl-CoA dehydrogenase NAD-binding domain-containing protein [Sideroxyarcus sp.]|nr:3-hydroxyacyl-CoA dehydrogenase NAD-binding domain-containing protein [Sideroxyarcus sp.]